MALTEEEKKAAADKKKADNAALAERKRIAQAEQKQEAKEAKEKLEAENAALKEKQEAEKDAKDESDDDGAGVVSGDPSQKDLDNLDWNEIANYLDSCWQRLGNLPDDMTAKERGLAVAHISKYKRLSTLARKQIK